MDESLTYKLITFIEKQIESFENEKFLEKNENRNLGIIYTPKEVVDYIVSNIFRIQFEEILNYQNETHQNFNLEEFLLSVTKNQKINGNNAKKIKGIRILDPSCGSGRFLISIAENLYKIHKVLEPELSDFKIKKAIIQNNLYGIEIENSAYIISKLRLIKWLLSTNIDKDFFHNINLKSLKLTNIDQIIEKLDLKFNIFNLDFLLELITNKFDIIIGNPPYVENKKIKDIEFKKKLTKRYKTAYRLFDLSILFIERSLELLEDGGYISFILPNKFLSADYGIKVRKLLLNESEIREIINISSLPIFQNTATYPIIISLKKTKQNKNQEIKIKILNNTNDLIENNRIKTIKFHQNLINKFPSNVIPISGNIKLITYLFNNFKTFAETCQDLKIIYRPFGFLNYSKHFDNISDDRQSDDDLLLIGTGNIEKYHIKFNKRIKIAGKDIKISYFNYNTNFEHIWSDLNSEKLIFREIAKNLTCCYDPGVFTNITGLYFIKIASFKTDQLFSLLTILNSKLLDLVFKTLFGTLHMAGGYLRFNGSFIKRLPMPRKFPVFLSQLGKIIHLLSQLKYDLDSKEPEIVRNPEIERFNNKYYNEIECYLKFFKILSNSLVNLLFLDDFYLESNLDYFILRELFDLNIEPPKIPYKFLIPRFDINNYKIYSLNELDSILTKIQKLYNRLHNNRGLINQIDDLMKNNFS
ncbi:MAG: N-6 DNA methylase [Candidatus Lokiarchaeota archaeon]|nr:N-6 DNA methylase [Candidatus Lokiarchaeota archaeon]